MRTVVKYQLKSVTAGEIQTHKELLAENFTRLCNIEDQLSTLPNVESKFSEIENVYIATKALLKAFEPDVLKPDTKLSSSFNKLVEQQQSFLHEFRNVNKQTERDVILPKLNIPVFSGDRMQWPTFSDLFQVAVHNSTTLSKGQKLQHLKTLLTGDAASLVSHLLSQNENHYEEAWSKLQARYNRVGPLITTFVEMFIEQPAVIIPNEANIRKLADRSDEALRALRALGKEERDHFLVYILVRKMDHETKQLWAREIVDDETPTIDKLIKFLNNRANQLEMLGSKKMFKKRESNSSYQTSYVSRNINCPLCSSNHLLYRCTQFHNMTPNQRQQLVNQNKLCNNCLQQGHYANNCRSTGVCFTCSNKHHTMLHDQSVPVLHNAHQSFENHPSSRISTINSSTIEPSNQLTTLQPSISSINKANPEATNQPSTVQSQDLQSTTLTQQGYPVPITTSSNDAHAMQAVTCTNSRNYTSLLPTAVILLRDRYGLFHEFRALLDSGSQSTFISNACAQKLMLPRQPFKIAISGIAASGAGMPKGLIRLVISSKLNRNILLSVDALVLPKLTHLLPPSKLEITRSSFSNLQLADPHFHQPSNVDVIIGADLFFNVICPDQIQYTRMPIAQKTVFGWVLAGSFNTSESEVQSFQCTSELQPEIEIDNQLRRFWELEEVPAQTSCTAEEAACETHFNATHHRNSEGRYTVSLPFQNDSAILGNSIDNALSRLTAMERKFEKNPILHAEYSKFMDEYLKLNHMSEIHGEEINKPVSGTYYLPHHAVIKEDSSSTRLRVVFDGSAKTSTQVSINDKLMVGPTVQPKLSSILLKFRIPIIAIAADIKQMYRQILVHHNDRDFQRIVWRKNKKEPIKHYQLNTITYGMSCSPFLATRTLNQLANDNKDAHPEVAAIITNNFYVDDLMAGADTVKEAVKLVTEITDVLESGGFQLRKWKSNLPSVLRAIPEEHMEIRSLPIEEPESRNSTKVLGIHWEPHTDNFCFKVQPQQPSTYTKRSLLSDASRIFDPLGWLAPAIISIKIIFQSMWVLKLQWDDPLPASISYQWLQIRKEFNYFEQLKIPRAVTPAKTPATVYELHGFCDSSNVAYAAVAYLKTINPDGQCSIRLLMSKTKVAPIKIVSIPRLELCGAALLTKLLCSVQNDFQIDSNMKIFAWCDSTTVLAWLSRPPRDWKPFIANRTTEILQHFPRNSWNYVKSSHNPADLASRGIKPSQLAKADLWWNGPAFLRANSITLPNPTSLTTNILEVQSEQKKSSVQTYPVVQIPHIFSKLFETISSWSKLIHTTCYIFRFVDRVKKQTSTVKQLAVTARESERATAAVMKYIQSTEFGEEVRLLNMDKPLPSSSSILKLHPFLDTDGLLRVGGRLQHSSLPEQAKHPVIVPKDHRVGKLIIEYYHKINLHPGTSLTLFLIRQYYWIINCRRLVNSCIHKCIICFKFARNESSQLMGNLPALRVQPSRRAFLNVGIDYAGPLTTKLIKVRSQKTFKSYICIFICLTTKAIHLEAVSDLTSDAFIATLKRFVSRRGLPAVILSDNAKNFIGASHELTKLMKHPDVISYSSSEHINWQFITPLTPHQGGLWEAGVRSKKYHLKRISHNQTLTFEELTTLLCQIEAVLNSRPLCAVTDDPDNLNVLTPGHILIGEALRALPEPNFEHYKPNTLSHWQHVQRMVQSFWTRFQLEYLNSLQMRSKWNKRHPNLQPNDIVLIKEEGTPPGCWKIGKIVKGEGSTDGIIRNYEVKTSKGSYRRNITKLIKLPIGIDPSASSKVGGNIQESHSN